MIRLIAVDDEAVMQEFFCHQVDWESAGIELLSCCANGNDAWKKIIELKPDVVLADINMPGLSGLDLAEKGEKELEEPFTTVLLTGYAEFDYAHRALENRIHYYLLKPCDEHLLKEAVIRAASERKKRNLISEMLPDEAEKLIRTEYSETVRVCINYIEKHYAEPDLSLKYISQNVLFMNVDYVGKQFFEQTGLHFVEYLMKLRIRKSKWLLANGTSINEVAAKVGYGNNPQYFKRVYTKVEGMTPKEFLQKQQANV